MFPQEIIVEICSRLPAKSVGRFRCVSKSWNSLLSQPQFIKIHLNQTKQFPRDQKSLIFLGVPNFVLYTTQFNIAHHLLDEITVFASNLNFANHCGINGVASCDGLVLVIDLKFNMWLLNPITMKIKELPNSHDALNYPVNPSTCGLFKCIYGFGYDSFSDDYKIVTMSFHDIIVSNDYRENECSERFVNVYSVRNNSWKKAEGSPYYHKLSRASGIYVNGCLHWVACRYSDFSDFLSVIATFDLRDERFYETPLPSSIDCKKSSLYLEMLGGCLVIQALNRFGVNDLWKMEEYGVAESWSRLSISNPDLQLSRPICFLGHEQMLLLEHRGVLSEKHILALWNLEDDTLKEVEVHGFEGRCFSTRTVVESLVSPYCYDEAI